MDWTEPGHNYFGRRGTQFIIGVYVLYLLGLVAAYFLSPHPVVGFLIFGAVVVTIAMYSLCSGVLFVYLSRSQYDQEPVRYWFGTLCILATGIALSLVGAGAL